MRARCCTPSPCAGSRCSRCVTGVALLLPLPLPAVGVPLIGGLIAALVDVLIAQAPKQV